MWVKCLLSGGLWHHVEGCGVDINWRNDGSYTNAKIYVVRNKTKLTCKKHNLIPYLGSVTMLYD